MVAREVGPEQSEGLDWRALIDCSPVATWAEDLSAIAWRFDELRAAGVVDAAAYFSARPEELSRLARLRRVVAASRPALVLFGAGDAEALRERVYDVVDEPCRAALASELAALWHGESLIETEWRVQDRVLSRRLAAATMSARGIGHVILAATDITEQRRTERELRFARFAVDRSHIPLFWIFSDASFFYVNEAACASLGYTREELLRLTILDVDPLFDRQRWERRWSDPNREVIFESFHRRKDGSSIPVEINSNHVIYEGVEYSCAFATDITERKREEDSQREVARRKDEFLAMLGHELRNPMASIRNAVAVLCRVGPGDARAEAARNIIDRQSAHMVRIVDDLLDMSRIARGKAILRREQVDWSALVRTTAEDLRPGFEAKGIVLTVSVPETALWVDGDPTRLVQVLSNLLHNAEKFTDRGGVHVDLHAVPGARTGRLTVEDTGIGMSPETLTGMFEPFAQANVDLARSRGGVGLGLALAKGLVELHGGSIAASSAGLGRGSRLTVELPLRAVPAQPRPEHAPPEPGRLRILVIEDNADAAESLKDLLALMGHQVETAADGPSGVRVALDWRPDAVLCDIGLPGEIDGYAVAKALRADPAMRSVLIVALTGYGQAEDQRRAKDARFDAHFTKPVAPDDLARALATQRTPSAPAPP